MSCGPSKSAGKFHEHDEFLRTAYFNEVIAEYLTSSEITALLADFLTSTAIQDLIDNSVAAVQSHVIGEIKIWTTSSTLPSGFILCNGQAISRTTYAELFTLWGGAFGNGNGISTFNVPYLQQRVLLGRDETIFGMDIGDTGGEAEHTLTIAELPAHSHTSTKTLDGSLLNASQTAYELMAENGLTSTGVTTSSVGSSTPHNNLQPFMVVDFIVFAGL